MNKKQIRSQMTLNILAAFLFALIIFLPVSAQEEYPERTLEPGDPLTQFLHLETGNPYVINIGQTQMVEEGINLTLDQILIEKGQITYALTLSGDIPERLTSFHFFSDLTANAELLSGGGTGFFFKVEGSEPAGVDISIINYEGDLPLDKEQTFTLKIENIDLYSLSPVDEILHYSIEGVWTFEFTADPSALTAATETYELNHSFPLDDGTFTLTELVVTPASQRLFATFDGENTPSVGYIGLQLDDGSEINLRCSGIGTNFLIAPVKTMTFYTNHEWLGNFTGNAYDQLKGSQSVTFIPYIGNPAAERKMAKDAPALESDAFTIQLKP